MGCRSCVDHAADGLASEYFADAGAVFTVGDDDGAGEERAVGAAEVDQYAVAAGDGIASTRATVGVFAFMTAD